MSKIFVIEAKDYSGSIYGNSSSKNWKYYLGKSKHEFYNPIFQNNNHIKKFNVKHRKGEGIYILNQKEVNSLKLNDEEINKIVSNEKLSEHYKSLARELNVVEPKHPD